MSTIGIRDASLFVRVVGHGYPLVLMHGGPGLDHTSLLSLRPLADQFTLVFYDHRWPEVLTTEPLLNVLRLTFEWIRSGGQ
jgi:pimeloyl-ACP methyl ester carboxylesterase